MQKIGEGGFANVYLAKEVGRLNSGMLMQSAGGRALVLKRMVPHSREQRAAVENEVKVMRAVSGHPNSHREAPRRAYPAGRRPPPR